MEAWIEEGPHRGARISLAAGRVLIGSAPGCAIPLAPGAREVHAIIESEEGAVTLTDCTGGADTAVNGLPLDGSTTLRPGDLVRAGGTTLRICAALEPTLVAREPEADYGSRGRAEDRCPHCGRGGPGGSSDPRHRDAVAPHVELVARSPAMREVVALLRQIAARDTTVLLTGESGSGKEVAAHAIVANSRRAGLPIVALNAAAVTESLIESELFGHEKGAFTGAIARRLGVFELADGGTLFLDEIGDLPAAVQPKLLRALELGEIRRLGGSDVRRVNVRVVAATNRDLRALVREGRFREDLYYRLAVVEVRIPPLRERKEDLAPLCEQILAALCRDRAEPPPALDDEALACLRAYRFPGNVRELRNVLEWALVSATGGRIRAGDLSPAVRGGGGAAGAPEVRALTLAEVERRHIAAVLEMTGWNKSQAARLLGLGRRTLYERIAHYGLVPPPSARAGEDGVSPPGDSEDREPEDPHDRGHGAPSS